MIAIFDRQDDRLPVAALLLAVVQNSLLTLDEPIALTRFGGKGEAVWEIESRLDASESVFASIRELQRIVSTPGQVIDELRCGNDNACIGVSDSTFMFFQSIDKNIEATIGSMFRQVTVLPDRS